DGLLWAAPATPPGPTGKVSIVFETFSVTTSTRPSGLKPICSGLAAPLLSACVEPGSGERPLPPVLKPEIVSEPALRTYRRLPRAVRLIGSVPPEETGAPSGVRLPSGPILNAEIVLSPAFT